MAVKTAVVLGGGIGGLVTARRLRERLGRDHRVVLVDREERHYFAPSFPWVMIGTRAPQRTSRDLALLSKKGIQFIHGAVTAVDLDRRRVHVEAREIPYDFLVVALGTEMWYEGVPGLAEAAHTYYNLDGAVRLRDALRDFKGGRVAVVIAGLPYRCPAAPYEGALLIDSLLRRRGLRDVVEMTLFTPEPAPMPVAGPVIGESVVELLGSRGVSFSPSMNLSSVDVQRRELTFESGAREPFDLLVAIPQHRAPAVARDSGLVGDSGWVEVDRHTLAASAPGVYALGDIAFIPLPSGLPLPKAGVFAHGQAEVVAENVASQLQGRTGTARFDGHGSCFLQVDYRRAAMVSGSFYDEPAPRLKWRRPGMLWQVAKVLFEWRWFQRWL